VNSNGFEREKNKDAGTYNPCSYRLVALTLISVIAIVSAIGIFTYLKHRSLKDEVFIERAYASTSRVKSYRVKSVQLVTEQHKTGKVVHKFIGELEVAGEGRFRHRLSTSTVFEGQAQMSKPECDPEESIVVNKKLYRRCGSRPWQAEEIPASVPLSPHSGVNHPLAYLANLTEVTELPGDRIDGIPVRVFQGRLDASKEAQRLWPDLEAYPVDVRQRIVARKEAYSKATITLTIWIGSKDFLIRRIHIHLDYPGSPYDNPYISEGTYEFSDFNAPIVIEPPIKQNR
jgi:hypothetical protein